MRNFALKNQGVVFIMNLGNSLVQARKNAGLTQEVVAEKLGVSRQTISKWELNETLPDIRQSKQLATLYHVTLDALIDFDVEVEEITEMINSLSEDAQAKVDWTALWAQKYPVLALYSEEVNVEPYMDALSGLLSTLKKDYHYNDEDAFLVLKDILAQLWKDK